MEGAGETREREAAELLKVLGEPDAIFMPTASDTLKDYLKLGQAVRFFTVFCVAQFSRSSAQPEDAVRALTAGFRGYAEMCNLLASWSEDAGCGVEEIQGVLVKTVADRVKAVYDPQCTRNVFQTKSRNVPWMNFMVTKPFWRSVLYELAEVHKSDAVLGLILSTIEELGHQDELATILLGFRLFNQALVQSISKMLSSSEQKLVEDLPKFRKMCAQSPNTYLYTQLVLLSSVEAAGASGERLLRLFQELHDHVVAEHKGNKTVSRLGYLLMGVSQHKELSTGLFVMLENGKTNPADINKVHRSFTQPENRPPVAFLHNTAFLEMLVDDLFITGREIPSKYLDKYVYCLAYATSPVAGEFVDEEDSRLSAVIKAIDMASSVAKKNFFGSELDRHLPLLHHYVASFPVVCMGLLRWIRCNMCDRSYYEKGTHSLSMGRFLSLVLNIAATQIKLRLHCVDLLKTAYETVETSQTEEGMAGEAARVKSDLLDAVVTLLLTDDGLVVAATIRWMEDLVTRVSTDTAIVRHFVKQLLTSVVAPFSPHFVEFVAKLLLHAIPQNPNYTYVQQLLKVFAASVPSEPSLIDAFLREAFATPRLSPKGQSLLAELQSRILPQVKPPVAVVPQLEAVVAKPVLQPAAIVKSATVLKIANLNPALLAKSKLEAAAKADKGEKEKNGAGEKVDVKKPAAGSRGTSAKKGTKREKKEALPKAKKAKKRRNSDDDDDEEMVDDDYDDEDEEVVDSDNEEKGDRKKGSPSAPAPRRQAIPRSTKRIIPAALLEPPEPAKKIKSGLSLVIPAGIIAKQKKAKKNDDDDAYLEFSDE